MSERAAPWRRAGRGLLLIGVGVFLLLNTTGVLPWSFWWQLLAFWPVALIALGIRLVFERSRVPAAILLSPLLVLTTMGWVAAGGPEVRRAAGRRVVLTAERPDDLRRWTLDGRIAHGEIDVKAAAAVAAGPLLHGEAIAPRSTRPVRVYTGDESARVRFGDTERARIIAIGVPLVSWSRWELEIARDLPVDVDMDMALTSGRLDLTGVKVTSIDLEGAFNEIELRLDKPDDNVRIELEGAFNRFKLVVPPEVPVRLMTDGFMNITRGRAGGGDGDGYRVGMEGAFNQVSIERRSRR